MSADIDIDFADRKSVLADLRHVPARLKDGRPHNSGVYFHDVPADPLNGLAVWDYEVAAEKGYFKVDFLNNTIYQGVRDEAHLVDLLTTEPPWERFDDRDTVAKLAHIHEHFPIVQSIRPRSIEDLAVCIALIRPGKKHLIGRPRAEIDQEIWRKTDSYHFKRAHAIAFAASIVVQLNLLDD
jgi:hypothetical protein